MERDIYGNNSVHGDKILTSDCFVREPVDIISKEIRNNKNNKIILTGGRGSGKSTVLYNLEEKSIGSDDQMIYTKFDSAALVEYDDVEEYDKNLFYETYYELNMAKKILNFIRINYGFTYKLCFEKLDNEIENIINLNTKFLNNFTYDKSLKLNYVKMGEYTKELIKKLKNELSINSLSLLIDRFDWTGETNELSQKSLSNYFDIFDKAVITTDDDEFEELENFETIDSCYGHCVDIVKEIVSKRFKERLYLPPIIDTNMYKKIINETNGNINYILKIIKEVNAEYRISKNNYDYEKFIDNIIAEINYNEQNIKSMNANPPKLKLNFKGN